MRNRARLSKFVIITLKVAPIVSLLAVGIAT